MINGRDAEKGARALDEISAGERGHFVAGDVTVRENVDAIIDGTVERFGRIDILVNNAGGLIKTAPVSRPVRRGLGLRHQVEPVLDVLG